MSPRLNMDIIWIHLPFTEGSNPDGYRYTEPISIHPNWGIVTQSGPSSCALHLGSLKLDTTETFRSTKRGPCLLPESACWRVEELPFGGVATIPEGCQWCQGIVVFFSFQSVLAFFSSRQESAIRQELLRLRWLTVGFDRHSLMMKLLLREMKYTKQWTPRTLFV